ncbi:MAG: methyltransferase domain-containing protein [Acidobacteria bacterium]|nr:methyltransferase domain-containing protein [Acidobacteriota bacterium]
MALACPVVLDTEQLRGEVSNIYARVASNPDDNFHFHRGPAYAAEFLGYDVQELAALPREATASFAGVGNPHAIAAVRPGETVVDIGCGAGMDLLLAARRTGPQGKAIGVDMSDAMIERASRAARLAALNNVELRKGDATDLPLADASVDVIISNGVLNLVPEKENAFREIVRILRPGGRLQIADIVVEKELSEDIRSNVELWTG